MFKSLTFNFLFDVGFLHCVFFILPVYCPAAANGQMLGHPFRSLLPSAGKDLVCYEGKIAPPFYFRLFIQLSFSCMELSP